MRPASVKMWGFYGPLGAFITAWGGVAMLVSAPFDDWWHNAYGLDVKILSPPHTVLAAGILAIEVGALILVLGYMNRAQGAERRRLEWLYLYLGSMILVVTQILTMEHAGRVLQHPGHFLPGDVDRGADRADRSCRRIRPALERYHRRRRLAYIVHGRADLDSSAVSGAAQARAGDEPGDRSSFPPAFRCCSLFPRSR